MLKRFLPVILVLLLVVGCGGGDSGKEDEWIEQFETERQQAQDLYSSNIPPEQKVEQAQQKMLELEEQYSGIMDESGKEADDPLIRGFIDVREMYVAIKNNDTDAYNQANNDAYQILKDNFSD